MNLLKFLVIVISFLERLKRRAITAVNKASHDLQSQTIDMNVVSSTTVMTDCNEKVEI